MCAAMATEGVQQEEEEAEPRDLSPGSELCQFCHMSFGDARVLEVHVKVVHQKVKVRKGVDFKWIDAAEARRRPPS